MNQSESIVPTAPVILECFELKRVAIEDVIASPSLKWYCVMLQSGGVAEGRQCPTPQKLMFKVDNLIATK